MSEKENIKVLYLGAYNKSEILPGPHKVAKRIFEQYSRNNKTMFVNYFQDGSKYSLFQKLFGYSLVDTVNGSHVILMGIFTLMFYFIKLRPRIVHLLNYERFVIFVVFLKIFLRFKLFYTVNGIIVHENKYYNTDTRITVVKNKIVEYVLINSCDIIFVLSELSIKILNKYYSADKNIIVKVFNGLDDIFLELPSLANVNIDKNSIVFIGDVDGKQKGFNYLLNVLEKIEFEVKMYVIDSKTKSDKIKCFNKNVKIYIENKLTPIDLKIFLQNKNVIISPSEYDNFNISVLEAISCGLQPILTNQTGIAEHICKNIDCMSYNYYDEGKLYSLLKSVIIEKEITRNVKSDYLRSFSWQSVMKEYSKKYKLYI